MKVKINWALLLLLLLPALACGGSTPAPVAPGIFTSTPPNAPPPTEPPPGSDIQRTPLPGPPTPTPRSKQDSEEAIEAYARDVLGFEVEITFATGLVQDLNIPLSAEEGVDSALALSGVTHFGLWPNGLAAVAFGEGSISGDYLTDIQNASLGAFSLRLDQPMPGDGAAALALLQSTYPALSSFSLVQDQEAAEGFLFYSAEAENYQLQSVQATLTGTVVRAGVAPGRRADSSVVWVVIASGALATPFK